MDFMIKDFKKYIIIAVRTWHLYFIGKVPSISEKCNLIHWIHPDTDEYLSLYKRVGGAWGWCGRLLLSAEELDEKLKSPFNEVWLFKIDDQLRGFFEIDRTQKGESEIVYLGLLPEEIGKGYGKLFLDTAIATASGPNNDRIWLHTCEYDHPKALEIYLKAGFTISKETLEQEYYLSDFIVS
jgi:GNAT superfamily N-acetyltransferase